MEVIHPGLNKPVQVVGVLYRDPLAKSLDFDTTTAKKVITFTPKGADVTVQVKTGAVETFALSGEWITVNCIAGTSTVASLQAVLTGFPEVAELIDISGDAGTFSAGFTGGTLELWVDRPIPPMLCNIIDKDGNVVPMSSSSLTIGTEVKGDNWDDDITVDLNTLRDTPGTEVTDLLGHSLAGKSLTVMACGGDAIIKLDYASTGLTTLTDSEYGTLQFVNAGSKIIRTSGVWNDDSEGNRLNRYPNNYAAVGTKITITGSDDNDGTFTVASVATTIYAGDTLVVDEALVDEAAGADEVVTGVRYKTGKTIQALVWPATVEIDQEFTKVYVENAVQAGKTLVLAISDRL